MSAQFSGIPSIASKAVLAGIAIVLMTGVLAPALANDAPKDRSTLASVGRSTKNTPEFKSDMDRWNWEQQQQNPQWQAPRSQQQRHTKNDPDEQTGEAIGFVGGVILQNVLGGGGGGDIGGWGDGGGGGGYQGHQQ